MAYVFVFVVGVLLGLIAGVVIGILEILKVVNTDPEAPAEKEYNICDGTGL